MVKNIHFIANDLVNPFLCCAVDLHVILQLPWFFDTSPQCSCRCTEYRCKVRECNGHKLQRRLRQAWTVGLDLYMLYFLNDTIQAANELCGSLIHQINEISAWEKWQEDHNGCCRSNPVITGNAKEQQSMEAKCSSSSYTSACTNSLHWRQ